MAVPHEHWSISNLNTSDQARVHIGHHNEYHDHRYYGDESQLSPAERQEAREDAILSSLSFANMNARERVIDSPCNDTFGWIFDEQVIERESFYYQKQIRNLMSRWLGHEHGMFFIVGKAGSGKSTLMRFLAGHTKTRTLLERWAGRQDCDLRVCAHYFWCSGSQLQCSQEGLWRSILHAIAKSDRKIASAMFADRAWDDGQTLTQVRSQLWARTDLTNALSRLVAQLEVQKVAVCLFIDGLDEYQGDEIMLITELRRLLRSPYIKICASSRPRNLFEQAFGHKDYQWKLALHLLTRGDMVQLARTRLYEDENFCKLVNCGDRRQDFVTAITEKSQGVFLWTVLVVREMIREAHQAGTINELEAHLEELPIELGGENGMYQRIVERSDPRYRKYMARLLLLMLVAERRAVLWEDFHFLYDYTRDAEFATRECLGLDDKYRVAWDGTRAAANRRRRDFNGDTSCRGLFLACHREPSGTHPRGLNCQVSRSSLVEDTKRQIRKWCPDFVEIKGYEPSFLHRSVKEYLILPENRERMADLAGPGFDPVLTQCCLRLAHTRLLSTPDGETFPERLWAKNACCNQLYRSITLHGGFEISRSSQAHAWFLLLILLEGSMSGSASWYLREKWPLVSTSDRQATGAIIIAGLLFFKAISTCMGDVDDVVRFLLRSGVDPNTKYDWMEDGFSGDGTRRSNASLWEKYIEFFPDLWASESHFEIRQALKIIQLLLHYGHADKQGCLPAGKKSLLSALTFEPQDDGELLNRQNCRWKEFAGQLHALLDAHGLLTREERHEARRQGWLPTKLKAPRSPQTTPKQSATQPDARPLRRWLRKLLG